MKFLPKNLPHLKDSDSRKEWEEKVWINLISQLASLQPNELKKVLETTLTPIERNRLAMRAVAISRFSTQVHYRSIAEETWISTQPLYALRRGMKNAKYASDWDAVKIRIAERNEEAKILLAERDWPKRYRRTKYGRTRLR